MRVGGTWGQACQRDQLLRDTVPNVSVVFPFWPEIETFAGNEMFDLYGAKVDFSFF